MASQTAPAGDIMFGPWKLDPREIFLESAHSFAIVNTKPVVPGHVLVLPRNVVRRFAELTAAEATDMWLLAQRVGQKLEPHFGATSLTFAIQDGPEAGQTVAHVHIHILPRKKRDFEKNDEVYDAINKSDEEIAAEKEKKLDLDKERKQRSYDEMAEEAAELRKLFK